MATKILSKCWLRHMWPVVEISLVRVVAHIIEHNFCAIYRLNGVVKSGHGETFYVNIAAI